MLDKTSIFSLVCGILGASTNLPCYITDQAFNELLPLVDGLVGAYVEQRKIQFT